MFPIAGKTVLGETLHSGKCISGKRYIRGNGFRGIVTFGEMYFGEKVRSGKQYIRGNIFRGKIIRGNGIREKSFRGKYWENKMLQFYRVLSVLD